MPRCHRTPGSPARRGLAAWLLATLICAPPGLPAALAAPEGEQVIHGEASFVRDGDLTVIRPSDGAIIEYQGFDVLGHETLQFVQPSEQARVLNRVFGDATRIDGTLLANGIVYLVNPAGIFYGRDAIVDVGELVNVGGTLGNDDFLNGVDRFALTGPVENLGSLRGSAISLLGTRVSNHGSILAPDGVIALVAGERVVLTQLEGGIQVIVDGPADATGPGIEHTGLVDAGSGSVRFAVGDHYSLALNHQGITRGHDIEVRAGAEGLVQVGGTLDASSTQPGGQGGEIRVLGDRVALVGARLDASGDAGGGAIRVGGDLRGEGPLPTARRTFVAAETLLRADALGSGDGGSVVVFGEEAAGFFGTLSARGGASGGDGGFAELSSNGLLRDDGSVDLRAPAGRAGTLLYDPQDIVIQGGTADGSDSPNTAPDAVAGDSGTLGSILFADVGTGAMPFSIFESEIEGSDANIVLEARNSITTAGTFDHVQSGEGAGVVVIRSGNDLTLRTANEPNDASGSAFTPGIDLTGSVHGADLEFRTSGDGTIALATGTGSAAGPEARIAVGRLATTGGNVSLITEDGSLQVGRIEASGGNAATDGVRGGQIVLDAGDQDGSNDTSVLVTGDLIARGGNGTSGRGGAGGFVGIRTRAGSPADSGGGSVTVMGDIDSSGGSGPAGGGNAGGVTLQAFVQGDISAGDIDALGGDAMDPALASFGGGGGTVTVQTSDGDISVGAIRTSGGDTDTADTDPDPDDTDLGGFAGAVRISAGVATDASGSILLQGVVVARGGVGVPDETEELGGEVTLRAQDAIEHDGFGGPHISTSGNVSLDATDIGAADAIEIDASGDEKDSTLSVRASGDANVDVVERGFGTLLITSTSTTSDIDVTQAGDEVRVDGDTIGSIDTTADHTDVRVTLRDELDTTSDVDLDLVVPTGSVVVGGTLELRGEDDVEIGDGAGVAIEAQLDPETGEEIEPDSEDTAANILIVANDDGIQNALQTGAIRSGGGSIDLSGDGSDPGTLGMRAAQGIGAAGSPILMQSGGTLAALTTSSGGIHVRNGGDGDLVIGNAPSEGLVGVRVNEGDGAIDIENTAGDLTLESPVIAPGDLDDEGGAVRLAAAAGSAIKLDFVSDNPVVDANGDLELDGDVTLIEDSQVVSRQGDVNFSGTLDTDASRGDRVRALAAVARLEDAAEMVEAGVVRIGDDVGVQNDLRNLTVTGDLALTGARNIDVTNNLVVSGDIIAEGGDDTASLAILAGPSVALGGNVGVGPGRRLSAFSITRNTTPPFPQSLPDPEVSFTGSDAQQIVTGAGGIAISPSGLMELPDRASIWKNAGDLRLESVGGPLNLGPNVKLGVAGRVDLIGTTVELGDVSALELHVVSPDARVRAREAGFVLLKSGDRVQDGGTDLLANVVEFSSAPSVEGTGPAPRIAGSNVTNPGALEVRGLSNTIDANRLFRGDVALDLAILPADPGFETPLRGPRIEGLIPPRASRESATGSALAPSADETLAWLRCGAELRDDCPAAPTGSPLDSPRGQDLARRAAALLGSSAEASSARAELAHLDPDALRQLAVLLTEVRLLGLADSEYAVVRDALFAELRTDVGPGAPDAGAFAHALQSQARGVPL